MKTPTYAAMRRQENARLKKVIPPVAHPVSIADSLQELVDVALAQKVPWRTKMMAEQWYQELDAGIRFAVRVLHARGFETCQSCQGGEGHPYDHPTIDLNSSGSDAWGLAAVSALTDYGIEVANVSLVWNIKHGLPYERLWRICLVRPVEQRADEIPNFIYGCQAQ